MANRLKRVLNRQEIEGIVLALRELEGAQLQDVEVEPGPRPKSMRLGLFRPGGLRWLLIDYDLLAPAVILFPKGDAPRSLRQKMRRPLELFLRSHFVGCRLSAVGVRTDLGRALDLYFGPDRRLELILIPHARNSIAHFQGKSVAEFKPMTIGESGETSRLERTVRTPDEILIEWLGGAIEQTVAQGAAAPMSRDPGAEEVLSMLGKKHRALEKVEAEVAAKTRSELRDVGEWVKSNQSINVPPEWEAYIDRKQTLAENIGRLFSEAKSNDRKIEGTRHRAHQLRQEIANLQTLIASETVIAGRSTSTETAIAPRDRILEKARARGRKYEIAPDLLLILGKNANENLAILRQAQPFDLWLHLRERPGAHGILRRQRGRTVKDVELMAAGIKVAEQSTKKRARELKGEVFDLLVVECRYVRPIKGDKNGRVHYTNDRVLRLKM